MNNRRQWACLLLTFLLACSISPIIQAATAIFAGGCFWCMQPPFDKQTGVEKTIVGYTGGTSANPNYTRVSSGTTHYAEAIKITYNPKLVSYQQLLTIFWHNIDPTRNDGQFCDRGRQYRPEIFYLNTAQKKLAERSKQKLEKSGIIKQKIKVAITPAGKFYPAENYHQDYYKKNPLRYKFYRYHCGRDKRLQQLWGSAKKH